jgi:anti-sigma factor RsiW
MRCSSRDMPLDMYLDGELAADEADAMRAHLASCRECAMEHERRLALSNLLRGGLVRRRAPDVLVARIRSQLAREDPAAHQPHGRTRTRLLAAGLLIAALSGGATSLIAHREQGPSTGAQVLASHIRSLMPGHLTDVESNDLHNVKPWFNGRVDLSPSVPRLDDDGFPLVGGRLDYIGGRPVPAVVYMHGHHVINVFSWPVEDGEPASAATSTVQGYHLVHWRDAGAEYWVASDLSVAELEQFVVLFTRSESSAATV